MSGTRPLIFNPIVTAQFAFLRQEYHNSPDSNLRDENPEVVRTKITQDTEHIFAVVLGDFLICQY